MLYLNHITRIILRFTHIHTHTYGLFSGTVSEEIYAY